MIPVPQYSSSAEMRAAYAARRRRLMGERPAPIEIEPPKPIPVRPLPPTWKRVEITFSAHVDAYNIHLAEQASPRSYIKRRAIELGTAYRHVVGDSRHLPIIPIRHLLMWETKQQYPLMSLVQIGKLFNRDHSTVIHAVRKIERERAAR